MIKKILNAIDKFSLDLTNKTVLTEAATGNYVVTPVIAAKAGAIVYAYLKDSVFGSVNESKHQVQLLAEKMDVDVKINFINSLALVDLSQIDIVTNCGFLRPINKDLINRLSNYCVIPLMYEPWEFRGEDIDIEMCQAKGIKVYGTNEQDSRLRTMDYLGYVVLYFLLRGKIAPFGSNVLLIGSSAFVYPVKKVLAMDGYSVSSITNYKKSPNLEFYDAIVVMEHHRNISVIGENGAFIKTSSILANTLVIHISGNVNFNNAKFCFVPKQIKKFGHMSVTTDFIDNRAVIDLHTGGLKVGEGMIRANKKKLNRVEYKKFMESNYPALAFDNYKYW